MLIVKTLEQYAVAQSISNQILFSLNLEHYIVEEGFPMV